jgi:TPR repeat protein
LTKQFNTDSKNIGIKKFKKETIQNFYKMNINEIGPTTKNIHENIFEEDLSIVIDELFKLYFKEVNEGREEIIIKHHVLNYINDLKINLREFYNWLLNNQNNSNSIYFLGYFNYNGIEININTQNALELYQKAVILENKAAQLDLAVMYIDGEGCDKNYEKAFEFSNKLAENGYSSGINLLAYCYDIGAGTDIDKEKAFELYQKAAELGNLNGLNNLGICYEDGVGTNIDKQKAFESYQKAKDLGSSNGITYLGWCYEEGFGTDVNTQKAFELYSMAANLKNKYAQYNLALMYENGNGVEKNMEQAIYWYKKSAKQEYYNAQKKLEEFSKKK